MKIGFMGVTGTGKTSIAQPLAELLNLPLRPSVNRGVFAKYGKTHKDMAHLDATMRKIIQLDSIHTKFIFDQTHADGIFDRTPLCHLMYLTLYCHEYLGEDDFDIICRRVSNSLAQYDHVFYCPLYPWDGVKEDGFREFNNVHRLTQQIVLVGLWAMLCEQYNPALNIHTLPDVSVTERLAYVRNIIEGPPDSVDNTAAVRDGMCYPRVTVEVQA